MTAFLSPKRFLAKKSLGQHFLTNVNVAEKMAAVAEITPGETIFEIGPGTGILTGALLKKGAHVIALEADIRAVDILKEKFQKEIAEKKLTLVHGDIRDTSDETLGLQNDAYKIVANIPYYLSGMLFRTTLTSSVQPKTIVFLVQKEVAERIARSTKESLLSLSVKAYGTPNYIQTVVRGNFSPPPKVDSAILLITDISKKRFVDVSEEMFFKVLKAGFAARRKQLLGNLTHLASRPELEKIFNKLKINETVRGEDLFVEQWFLLARELKNI